MKKLFLLLVFICVISINCTFAEDNFDFRPEVINASEPVKTAQIIQIQDADITKTAEVLFETYRIIILKVDEHIGIFNKETNTFMYSPVIDEIQKISDNNYEFKIRVSNLLGYLNTDTEINFLGSFDDINLLGNYLKVKKDNRFGLLDKTGNIILKPIFSKISLINSSNTDYIAAKNSDKYQIYNTDGKLLSDDELYTVVQDKSELLARDIRPDFIKYKNVSVEDEIKNADFISDNKKLTINDKGYTLINEKGKIGLNNELGLPVIPAKYELIELKRPCRHYSEDLIYVKNDNLYTVYNEKGDIISEQFPDRIEVYKYGRNYIYERNDNKWILKLKEKQLGILENIDGKYKFTRTAYHFRDLHKLNKLLISIISL